ncbi:MAG: recombinase zinc beta ribbon domain-containing protein [Clostridia bacterium]|nr:recombinase zinc beta ribbon domain-containing protein [Clostridia bacterium]
MKCIAGTTIQNKRSRISYKNRKLRPNPKEQWSVVENTHEPIIEKKAFEMVQKIIIVQKHGRNEKKHHFLLDGLLICYECKHKIGVRARKDGRFDMVCNNYRRNSKLGLCTSHGFNYENLEKMILEYIKKLFLEIDHKKIELDIQNSKTKYDYGKILQKLEAEIKLIHDNMDQMYVDKLNKKISEEMYQRLFKKLQNEEKQKEKEYIALKSKQENYQHDDTEEIKRIVKDFLNLEKPSAEMLRVIINRIEIHQDKQVDIIFNFKKLNNINYTSLQ